jgi:hypothetical protein
LSFKFIAIAYGMLGATAATGYMVQGGGGGAVGKRPSGHVAEQPKPERVAKLEMPPKAAPMPQVAMVASSPQDDSVVMTSPAAPGVALSSTPLTAPPTPAPPPPPRMAVHEEKPAEPTVEKTAEKPDDKPAGKIAEKPAEKPPENHLSPSAGRNYIQITADMLVNPWTGEWLTSDDRSMGYLSGPAKGPAPPAAPAPVMMAEAQPPTEPPAAAQAPAVPPPAREAAAPPAPPPAESIPVRIPVSIPVTTPIPVKASSPPATRQAAGQQHGYMAHLASYRDEVHAAAGWKTLQKAHRDLLINRSPVTVTAEIPGQGTFVRLMADGFGQLAEVSEFCSEFKASGQYCTPVKAK